MAGRLGRWANQVLSAQFGPLHTAAIFIGAFFTSGGQPCHNRVKVCRNPVSMRSMRDFLSATRERVLVYDGGMGATLEQFDLSLERDYKLPGRCHEALVLNRPDVIEGVHR